jgi:XisI protein
MELKAIQQVIHTLFEDLGQGGLRPAGIQQQVIMDDERSQYQLLSMGWDGMKRTFDVFVHVSVRDGFVWIEVDNTDRGIADALVELGIPKNKIVLGFQAPYKRKFTEFATGDAA